MQSLGMSAGRYFGIQKVVRRAAKKKNDISRSFFVGVRVMCGGGEIPSPPLLCAPGIRVESMYRSEAKFLLPGRRDDFKFWRQIL